MREIKFRGKDIETAQWITGDLIQRMGYMPSIMFPYESKGKIKYGECAIKRDTIGQYIGLKDNNGKEIYEGDVLHIKEYENLLSGMLPSEEEYTLFTINECMGRVIDEYEAIVCCDEGCMMLKCKGKSYDMIISVLFGDMRRSSPIFEFKIIGNIYDNPDLITSEK